jgi:hypothetical protein
MNDEIIIATLAQAIQEGRMTLDNVPEKYREKVEELLKGSE